ncbi:MAG: sigma-54-dependent Fis family transcriptional regulator [Bryobacteraceae bacterium]|nr:sigma-54-dependent Fis family transcriptional regulator [Bryobacteraceae bacterium]
MEIRLLASTREGQSPILEEIAASLQGLTTEIVETGSQALEALKAASFDSLLACFPLPDWTPDDFVEEARRVNALTPVLIHDAAGGCREAVRLTKLGAFHYVSGASPGRELAGAIEAATAFCRDLREASCGSGRPDEPWRRLLVGQSKAMRQVTEVVRLVGPRRCTVMVSGETGTGKEMVARAVHMASARSHLPLVAVNCSALPENLLEAELFGHVRGAFTGAFGNRIGRFEQAHRGTIFLDEISDMPLDLQAKLLRVLQEREFQRLGSSETIKVDVRVVAATNVNLADRVAQGKFREDLYYRLNVVPLNVPPLRERLRDVPLLVHHFIQKICRQEDLPLRETSPETLARLSRYSWPGNVRQLENAVEMAIALSGDRITLYPSDFPLPPAFAPKTLVTTATPVVAVPDDGLDFEAMVGGIEKAILEQALRKTGGNKKQAADMLRLKRTTLAAKLKSLEDGGAKAHACAAV